jgi:two-component system, NarL family, sensor histidine kinase DegS
MSSKPKGNPAAFSRRYSATLERHLGKTTGASLRPAENLGRAALAAGLDTLDLFSIHERALATLLGAGSSPGSRDGVTRRTTSFLAAVALPIARAQRAGVKQKHELHRLNPSLRQRTVDLAAVRRQLKREIARREAAQNALAESEKHYGQLLERSRHMQNQLRRLSHRILFAQEAERRRVSRELHDELGQTLTAINVRLATLKNEATVSTRRLAARIGSTQRLVERSMKTVHRFARELRPPQLDDLGLIPALTFHMKDFTKRTRIPVHFTAFATVEQLSNMKRTVLYRVAQEALANVAKHAQASSVRVSIQRIKGLVDMEIHDDGVSFDLARVLAAKRITRLGLLGMRERVEMVGGAFSVESAPGKGTTIRAQLPFNNGRSGSSDA